MNERNVLDRKAVYREAYLERLSAQMDLWSSRITKLMARSVAAEAGVRMAHLDMVDDLDRKRRTLHVRLLELKVSGEEVWDRLKRKVEDAAEELKQGLEQAWRVIQD